MKKVHKKVEILRMDPVNLVIHCRTQGQFTHGWSVFEAGFRNEKELKARFDFLTSQAGYESG